MRWNKINAIFKKEIRELLRDKKTLFVMFALPLIIYPLLIIAISTIMINVQSGYETKVYTIGLDSSVTDNEVIDYIKTTPESEDEDETGETVAFEFVDCEDYGKALSQGNISAYLEFKDNTYEISYNSSNSDSAHASDYLRERLEAYKEGISLELFAKENLDADKFLNPIKISLENLASDEQSMGSILGMIVPLLLIMGVFIGTMTPAMDSTAGEKERGTQETLMSFPISGHELICGKYLAVSAAGVVSAFLYLVSVGILAGYILGMSGAASEISFDFGLFIPALLVVIISTIAFALFLGAVIMCICSFAKSTKEASSYISPMMVVIMLIAYAGYLNIKLDVSLSIVPVLNIVLLIKSVLTFEYNTLAIAIVLISNIAYAAIAITFLGKLYTSERILFGENFGTLFERHSERKKGATPAIGDGILVLAVTAVLFLYLGGIIQMKLMLIGVGISHIILIAVPLLAAWYGKIDIKKTFSCNWMGTKNLPAVILIAIGGFIVCNMASQPFAHLAQDSAQNFSNTFSVLMESESAWLTWLIIGIVPAISEEILFRGYFMASLREKVKPATFILITSLLFGVYHMNLYQGFYAFLLGILIAYTVYKTNSIFAGSLIHFICNSTAVVLSTSEDIGFEKLSTGGLIGVIAIGVVLLVVGIILISRKKNEATAAV